MSIRRITISVPVAVAGRIKKAAGRAAVSAWVAGVIEEYLDEAELDRAWRAFYDEVKPSSGDVKRAEAILKRLTKPRSPKAKRAA